MGFVLTLMARDLAYFLGNPYSRIHGPQVRPFPIPFLQNIPFVGEVFFSHNIPVYLSLILIGVCWWYLFRTSQGLKLRSVGENPKAFYARGIDPKNLQIAYALIGGMLVGLAGATFSLFTKPGWGRPCFFLQVIGIYLQGWLPSAPAQDQIIVALFPGDGPRSPGEAVYAGLIFSRANLFKLKVFLI